MSQYLLKYKGKYRILPVIDLDTNDFPRDSSGNIEDDLEIYISCRNGNKIEYYGLNESRRAVLLAYIPSLGRGRNIKKALEKQGVDILYYDESDEEVLFHFNATDIEVVADLLKAKTSGANISPFSVRNLPVSNVKLPSELEQQYRNIISSIDVDNMSIIKKTNDSFLEEVEKKLKKKNKDKKFSCRNDMKRNKMSRQIKEYIWKQGYWDEYIEYLKDAVKGA